MTERAYTELSDALSDALREAERWRHEARHWRDISHRALKGLRRSRSVLMREGYDCRALQITDRDLRLNPRSLGTNPKARWAQRVSSGSHRS